jgi:hypothetical protein
MALQVPVRSARQPRLTAIFSLFSSRRFLDPGSGSGDEIWQSEVASGRGCSVLPARVEKSDGANVWCKHPQLPSLLSPRLKGGRNLWSG